jgi:hypothetical protein
MLNGPGRVHVVSLPQCLSEKVPRLVFVFTLNDLVIPLEDDVYSIPEHMGSRREITSLCNVFCGPDRPNQMGIKALVEMSKNAESKYLTYCDCSIGFSLSGKEEEGGTLRMGDAKTVESKKLLKVGQEIRTIGREIHMIRIRAAVACANFEFLAAEVQMPVTSVVLVEVLL